MRCRIAGAAAAGAIASILVACGAGHSPAPAARTPIQHVVVIIQENHSFDSYFASYCAQRRDPGTGQELCDGGPSTYPGTTVTPVTLDDRENGSFTPNHLRACEAEEIDGGRMDRFLTASSTDSRCGAHRNYAYASTDPTAVLSYYHQLASDGALADRFFQPAIGSTLSNDQFLWTTRFSFDDNTVRPAAVGARCSDNTNLRIFDDIRHPETYPNLGHALTGIGVSWTWYAEGYDVMRSAGGGCAAPPPDCPAHVRRYPCLFTPGDDPAEYFASSVDSPAHIRDYTKLSSDLAAGRLPSVVFVKAVGYHTEHPGDRTRLSDGVRFVRETINAVEQSPAAGHTLILLTWDESGGYYDHVVPPESSDDQPYGARVPMIAIGPFSRAHAVSHQIMELSSITRFIEWNWLKGTGQLHGRDAHVANIGSLLRADLDVPA